MSKLEEKTGPDIQIPTVLLILPGQPRVLGIYNLKRSSLSCSPSHNDLYKSQGGVQGKAGESCLYLDWWWERRTSYCPWPPGPPPPGLVTRHRDVRWGTWASRSGWTPGTWLGTPPGTHRQPWTCSPPFLWLGASLLLLFASYFSFFSNSFSFSSTEGRRNPIRHRIQRRYKLTSRQQ